METVKFNLDKGNIHKANIGQYFTLGIAAMLICFAIAYYQIKGFNVESFRWEFGFLIFSVLFYWLRDFLAFQIDTVSLQNKFAKNDKFEIEIPKSKIKAIENYENEIVFHLNDKLLKIPKSFICDLEFDKKLPPLSEKEIPKSYHGNWTILKIALQIIVAFFIMATIISTFWSAYDLKYFIPF